jgi:hypothetical protein
VIFFETFSHPLLLSIKLSHFTFFQNFSEFSRPNHFSQTLFTILAHPAFAHVCIQLWCRSRSRRSLNYNYRLLPRETTLPRLGICEAKPKVCV